jgi:hypothetical protein
MKRDQFEISFGDCFTCFSKTYASLYSSILAEIQRKIVHCSSAASSLMEQGVHLQGSERSWVGESIIWQF